MNSIENYNSSNLLKTQNAVLSSSVNIQFKTRASFTEHKYRLIILKGNPQTIHFIGDPKRDEISNTCKRFNSLNIYVLSKNNKVEMADDFYKSDFISLY